MKICPSCGAEIEDSATKCPICEAFVPETVPSQSAVQVSAPPIDLSAKLSEMRAKIEQLTASSKAQEPQPEEKVQEEEKAQKSIEEVSKPEEPLPSEAVETSKEPEEVLEEVAEEEVEEEYEEIIVETRQIGQGVIDRDSILSLGKPKRKKEEATGRKISIEEAREIKRARTGIRPSYFIATALVIVIIVIASFVVLTIRPTVAIPAVDGIWDEWNSVSKFPAFFGSNNPSLNIEETAVQLYKGSIFWYFHTTGDLYKTSDRVISYALLIDSDGDPETGFSFYQEFGADYMAMISGSGGEALSSTLYVFDSDDNLNWSAWKSVKTLRIATLISKCETNFTAPAMFSSVDARFVSIAFDGKSQTCMTVIFSLSPGVLVITQGSLVPSTGVLLAEPNQHVLQLLVRAYGAIGEVESIVPTVTGAETTDLGRIAWRNKDEMRAGTTLTLSIDCSSLAAGTKITAFVEKDDIETDYGSIMITGRPAIGYVGNIPPGITIDGVFADWSDFTLDMGDPVPPSNRNIDLTRTALSDSATDVFFYGEVFGRILNGSLVPVEESIIGPGGVGGSSEIREKVTGEDILQIFIDVDPFDDIGAPSPVANATLEPDFMIEIRGRNGLITQKTFCEWTGGYWLEDELVEINAAIDSQRIEIGIAKSMIGSMNGSDIAMISTDWLGGKDDFAIASVSIDPFKITLQGDVWGSLDGTSWIPKADVLNNTNSLVDLTSDNAGNLYAIFTNGTVYVSHDLANSWMRLIIGSMTNVVAITSDGVGQLYAIRSSGETYNAAFSSSSWTYRGDIAFANDVVDLDWSYGTTPGTACLYAVRAGWDIKLVRSTDGGVSWFQYKNKPPTNSTVSAIAVSHILGEDLIYVLERDGDVYVSNDSATTWVTTHISPGGSPDFVASPCVDLDLDSNGNLWVVRAKGEVYRLMTSTWTWETLYGIGDLSDVNAISSVPIPEFSDSLLFAVFGVVVSLICVRIYGRKRRPA